MVTTPFPNPDYQLRHYELRNFKMAISPNPYRQNWVNHQIQDGYHPLPIPDDKLRHYELTHFKMAIDPNPYLLLQL